MLYFPSCFRPVRAVSGAVEELQSGNRHEMNQELRPPQSRDWYSVSVDTIRGWVIFCSLTAAAVLAFFGWQRWEHYALEQAAVETLEEAGMLIQEVEAEPEITSFEAQYGDARRSFETARQEFSEGDLAGALSAGRRSVSLLSSILSALSDQGASGEAQIVSLTGRVEVKRAEYGDWEDARLRTSLREGNFVRTSRSGSAEIMFVDGTLYSVRPNTLFVVSARDDDSGDGGQSIRMEYGWVDLSTTQRASLVETPEAEARVQEDSSATVSYDRSSKEGRFASYEGGMRVDASDGSARELGTLEEVLQEEGALSEARPLPPAPRPLSPDDNLERDRRGELVLAWEQVESAARYALQVSRNQLFADTLIDVDQRTKPSATLGLRGEGSFAWRVAAIDGEGRRGPWSPARRFRVKLQEESGASDRLRDNEPPALALDEIQAYGSLFIVAGRTEPGATVTVRGEPVTVDSDGSFAKTIQVFDRGWNFVEVAAKDAYGNEEKRPLRLYVDNL